MTIKYVTCGCLKRKARITKVHNFLARSTANLENSRLPRPPQSVSSIIFDVDGVLVDSYTAHFESWRITADEIGVSFNEAAFVQSFGRTSREIIRTHLVNSSISDDVVGQIDARKELIYRELVYNDFPAMEGAKTVLKNLHGAGWKIAFGSSGPPENVELAIDRLGCRAMLKAVVTGADVTHGKPDPEVFLLAADRMQSLPSDCIVVEDAPAGIQAARRAGMHCIAMLSKGRRHEQFKENPPDRYISGLLKLTPQLLQRVFQGRA